MSHSAIWNIWRDRIIINFESGGYRALIDVDFVNEVIKVQVLDHRSKIYKRYKK